MIYRYVSAKTVVTRLRRIFDNTSWIGMAHIYMADCIQELGYAERQRNSVTLNSDGVVTDGGVIIANHKGELPCDLESIYKVERVEKGNSNNISIGSTGVPITTTEAGTSNNISNRVRMYYNKDSSMNALSCDDYVWRKENRGDWYDIDYPFIRTSFESGSIDIFYKAFKIDGEGYIMIPDIPSYRNALQWYVIAQLILEGVRPKLAGLNYDYSYEKYLDERQKAKSKVKGFSEDEQIAFAQMWTAFNTQYVERNYMESE